MTSLLSKMMKYNRIDSDDIIVRFYGYMTSKLITKRSFRLYYVMDRIINSPDDKLKSSMAQRAITVAVWFPHFKYLTNFWICQYSAGKSVPCSWRRSFPSSSSSSDSELQKFSKNFRKISPKITFSYSGIQAKGKMLLRIWILKVSLTWFSVRKGPNGRAYTRK